MTRFQFVADHQDTFEVKRLCALVEIERSSFYAWKAAEPAREARTAADALLAEKVRAIHAEDNTTGAPPAHHRRTAGRRRAQRRRPTRAAGQPQASRQGDA